MAWNTLYLEIDLRTRRSDPIMGEGGFTYDQALTEIQKILDQLTSDDPAYAVAADRWRQGGLQKDTLRYGAMIFAVYEYDGDDPLPGAVDWLNGFAAMMSEFGAAGVRVEQLPGT